MKNWQLKITPINKKEDDQLSHNLISELLKDKINSLIEIKDIPSCICLNGEYGSGKTTIVNLLLKSINGSTSKKVVLFNAWRHKDENIHYALFRNIFYAIKNKANKDFRDDKFIDNLTQNGEIEELDNEFNNLVYSSVTNNKYNQESILEKFEDFIFNKLHRAMTDVLIFTFKKLLFTGGIIGALAALICFFISNNFIQAIKVFFITLGGSIVAGNVIKVFLKEDIKLLPKLIEVHISPDQISTTLPKINNTEQLQGLFRKILNQFKISKKGENVELIIIVEDIDRKHSDEIISTLNELRTFIDLGKAIFIIPCDTRNVERAFQEKNKDTDNVNWKAKDFCAKIFSHTITIPPQNKQDLRKMLLNKINTEIPDHPIKELLDSNENNLENLIDILIMDSVKTPREAINIFNRFTMQLEYALKLEDDNKRLKKGTISNNILQYARVYILGYYYNLEKYLLEHHELLKWIVKRFRGNINNIPEYARKYLDKLYDNDIIKSEIEEYVSRTEHYDSDLIKPFIYLDETSYSGIAGNKFYLDIYSYLRNRDKMKLEETFENEDKKIVSEAITKIINNLNYTSEYLSIIPSLIDIFDKISSNFRTSVADFILEHLHSINEKTLYEFDANSIFNIISQAHYMRQAEAKKVYLGILDKDNIYEITNEDRLLDICLTSIMYLDTNEQFINIQSINKISSVMNLELNNKELEYNHISTISQLINKLKKDTIIRVFDYKIIKRISNQIKINLNDKDNKIKDCILRLFEILANKDCLKTLEMLDDMIIDGDIPAKEFYFDIINNNIDLVIKKDDIFYLCANIYNYILKSYLKSSENDETDVNINKALFEKGLIIFAKLDGYLFNKLEIKENVSYDSFNEDLEEALKKSSLDELNFWYKIIDTYEENASYHMFNSIIDIILEHFNRLLNSNDETLKKEAFNIITEFMIKRSSKDNIDEENQNKIISYVLKNIQQYMNTNTANNINSEYLLDLIKRLIMSNSKFINLVCEELSNKDILINNTGYQFKVYKHFFELLKFLDKSLKYEYVKKLIKNIFDRFISSYQGTIDKAMPAWKFIWYLINTYHLQYNDIMYLIDNIFSNYDNRVNYFTDKIKLYIIQIINIYKNNLDKNNTKKYKNLFLEGLSEFNQLVHIIKDNWDIFNINEKSQILSYMLKYDSSEKIEEVLKSNVEDFEILCKDFIVHSRIKDLNNIYEINSQVLNWTSVISEGIINTIKQNNNTPIDELNSINNNLLKMLDISDEKEIFDDYLIANIKEEYDKKIQTLIFLDKIEYKIEKNSDIFISIVDNFVNELDYNTDYYIVERLYNWLKKYNLVKESNVCMKIKEILESNQIEEEIKAKYISLLKYGK